MTLLSVRDLVKHFPIKRGVFGKVSGQVLTAQRMDQFNEFGKAPAVTTQAFEGALLADGILKLDLPAKSVVVVSLE